MSEHHPEIQPPGDLSGLFTIRSYLLLMIVAIILPMLVLVVILAWDYGAAGRRVIEAERLDAASDLMLLTDREVQATVGFLGGLATSLAHHPSDPRFADNVIAGASDAGLSVLAVHDRGGRLLTLSPVGMAPNLVSARALGVADVLAEGRSFVSDFVAGDDGLKPGLFFVSVPVLVDNQVVLVLSGGVRVDRLQPLLAEAGLPEGWLAGLVDRQGVMLARRLRPEAYVGTLAQAPMLEVVRSQKSIGMFDVASRDGGIEVKNSFRRSTISGWTVGVAVPASIVNAPLHRSAVAMAVIGLAFTVLSLLLGSLVAGRISRAVQQLGMASAAFAGGHAVPLPTSMLTELQDVATAMKVSAERAKQREAASRDAKPG